jgi:hypothetical protein
MPNVAALPIPPSPTNGVTTFAQPDGTTTQGGGDTFRNLLPEAAEAARSPSSSGTNGPVTSSDTEPPKEASPAIVADIAATADIVAIGDAASSAAIATSSAAMLSSVPAALAQFSVVGSEKADDAAATTKPALKKPSSSAADAPEPSQATIAEIMALAAAACHTPSPYPAAAPSMTATPDTAIAEPAMTGPASQPAHSVAERHPSGATKEQQTTQSALLAEAFSKTVNQPIQASPATFSLPTPAHDVTPADPPRSLHGEPAGDANSKTTDITAQLADALTSRSTDAISPLSLHVSLTPQTLGTITLKVSPDKNGDISVILTASQPTTLEILKRDVSRLNDILTNAGISDGNRQIDFQAASVAAPIAASQLGSTGGSLQGGTGGQHEPRHGTGIASPDRTTMFNNAMSPPPTQSALPHQARSALDMIA